MRVRLLHCMSVRLRIGYTQAYVQIMQHTHTHKAVTGRVEAKKLLSRRRQSNYSLKVLVAAKWQNSLYQFLKYFQKPKSYSLFEGNQTIV